MSQMDLTRFRRMCAQFRWLAVFMVVTIGGAMLLTWVGGPLIIWLRDGQNPFTTRTVGSLIWFPPAFLYLFGVWSIGSAMGQLSKGRLIQPILSSALRRVGLSLGLGGVMSVFVVPNVVRLMDIGGGALLHFDVAGMTLGMIGGALFLLGGVVEQAGRVQAELDEMI